MKSASKTIAVNAEPDHLIRSAAFWLCIFLLISVPLASSSAVHRIFSLPKFAILLVGSAALVPLIALAGLSACRNEGLGFALRSKHVLITSLYSISIVVSTIFGVAPMATMFGSFENQMGLMTRLCFFVCFLSLIVGIAKSRARLEQAIWAMAVTGLVVAAYACFQFFGGDPFLPSSLYTHGSVAGPVVRVISTLGHADYLGNFLLYTTPLSASLAITVRGRTRLVTFTGVALSIAAITFSGTRGAALGLGAGAVAFALLELPGARLLGTHRGRTIRRVAVAFGIVVVSIFVISLTPASRNIVARARSTIAEGMSGSGRTLLWRDSIKVVPAFALTGCGTDGFRKVFPAYKSKELARLAPQTNQESSHNAYLDAAISYGLPGAILYVAMIASALSLLTRTRRRIAEKK